MKIKPELQDEYNKYATLNSGDPYSNRVVTYAQEWADLMEPRLTAGESLKDIAKETSRTADTDGITGYMYGAAVSALAHFWAHGEELRRWHNLGTQLGTEGEQANKNGGTLNPALLTIEV